MRDGGVGWEIFYFKIFPRDGVPVPLGQAREREEGETRGENQSEVIVPLLGGDQRGCLEANGLE